MEKTKLLAMVISVVLASSLLFAGLATAKDENSPLALIWNAIFGIQEDIEDLQTQVDELEVTSGATRYVVEVSFDVTQDGDLIKESPTSIPPPWQYHWKRIDVSQITLSDMPIVKIYEKNLVPIEGEEEPVEMWREVPESAMGELVDGVTFDINSILFDESCIYIQYKMYGLSGWTYFSDGNYKIVLVK